ncbi:MAG: precorrin-6y C5,15-methyltransferase (decarboxylating) subunit CbiE [Clostridium sp.]|nr:precorrin-6y C5,15-methyltransferase (decarboxylating) subunit CbiE [Clostridium sp.]
MDDIQPIVYLVGIGMGSEDQLTGRAMDCLEAAQVIMGADRMLDSVRGFTENKRIFAAYKPSEMVQWLGSFRWDEAALVLSGDTGFYSGAEAAGKAFMREGWDVEYVPGVSSLSYICSRLGKSWQNVRPLSSHGRDCDAVGHIRKYRSSFILLGGGGGVSGLCRQLVSSGMSGVKLWAGENFSYEDERITWEMTPAELLMEDEHQPFGSLACVLVENPDADEGRLYPEAGPSDDQFIRGQVPMTKAEVRRISLEKLRIGDGAVCYDIGSGTGSVAVEMGMAIRRRDGGGELYAIERKREALQLIESNCQKFHGSWSGFHIVEGEAPEALEGLTPPTHAFIGGSNGRMREIVARLLAANPQVRMVANAITLETVGEILECMRTFEFEDTEMVQILAAPVEQIGNYRMPKAQNPVYIAVMQYPSAGKEEIECLEL